MQTKGQARSKSLHIKSDKKSSQECNLTVKDCLYWPTAPIHAATKIKPKRSSSEKRFTNKNKVSKVNAKRSNEDAKNMTTGKVNSLATKLEGYYIADDDDDPVNSSIECKQQKQNYDPSLSDLLSYRYFRESQEQKKHEDDQKKQMQKDASKVKRERRNDFKSNKTSQLRSIAISSSCDGTSKQELWKMNKFANVQPKVFTGKPKEATAEEEPLSGTHFLEKEYLTSNSYEFENDTSRFKEANGSDSFLPPGSHIYTTGGLSPDSPSSKNFSYEYLPSTNISQF